MIIITFYDTKQHHEYTLTFYSRESAWKYLNRCHRGHRVIVLDITADDPELMRGLY